MLRTNLAIINHTQNMTFTKLQGTSWGLTLGHAIDCIVDFALESTSDFTLDHTLNLALGLVLDPTPNLTLGLS